MRSRPPEMSVSYSPGRDSTLSGLGADAPPNFDRVGEQRALPRAPPQAVLVHLEPRIALAGEVFHMHPRRALFQASGLRFWVFRPNSERGNLHFYRQARSMIGFTDISVNEFQNVQVPGFRGIGEPTTS